MMCCRALLIFCACFYLPFYFSVPGHVDSLGLADGYGTIKNYFSGAVKDNVRFGNTGGVSVCDAFEVKFPERKVLTAVKFMVMKGETNYDQAFNVIYRVRQRDIFNYAEDYRFDHTLPTPDPDV